MTGWALVEDKLASEKRSDRPQEVGPRSRAEACGVRGFWRCRSRVDLDQGWPPRGGGKGVIVWSRRSIMDHGGHSGEKPGFLPRALTLPWSLFRRLPVLPAPQLGRKAFRGGGAGEKAQAG